MSAPKMSSGFKIWAQETSDVFHEEFKYLREIEIQNKQKSYWRYRISQEQKEVYNQKSKILKIEKKEREIWIPKNPKNPYEVWIQKNFEKFREKDLERNSEDVVRKLDEIWRKMTEKDKIPYIEEYEEIKEDQKEKRQIAKNLELKMKNRKIENPVQNGNLIQKSPNFVGFGLLQNLQILNSEPRSLGQSTSRNFQNFSDNLVFSGNSRNLNIEQEEEEKTIVVKIWDQSQFDNRNLQNSDFQNFPEFPEIDQNLDFNYPLNYLPMKNENLEIRNERKYENWPEIDPKEPIFFDLPDGPDFF
ncbi:hypothetical protein B9Z55_008095 [Caenorhabditis nigoni]|uniref:HMG box domain-containing protein n=1 Tax=Caenorhabditis nigoni TaxID=1611254 RepID=A0A2G5VCP2_9PELO|nr:hypothetical protein B9Z55_008095 [Caenorhabditis nigoni]